jgi:hypothetical protein
MAEYPTKPKLTAIIGIASMFQAAPLKAGLMADLHASLCYSDAEFPAFQELYSLGCYDASILTFIPAPLLPGFDRLVRADSSESWIDLTTVLINSACYLDIRGLERAANAAFENWKRFSVASKPPKDAQVAETELYMILQASNQRAGFPPMDSMVRAQELLSHITLTIQLQGKPVSVRELIRDQIAGNHMGKAAVTADFVFKQYEFYYLSSGVHGCDSRVSPPQTTQQINQAGAAAKVPVVLAAVLDYSTIPVKIVCRECKINFEEVPAEWAAKAWSVPKSCKACLTSKFKRMRDPLMSAAESNPAVMIVDDSRPVFDMDPESDDEEGCAGRWTFNY